MSKLDKYNLCKCCGNKTHNPSFCSRKCVSIYFMSEKRIDVSGTKNPHYGRFQSEDTRNKIREKALLRYSNGFEPSNKGKTKENYKPLKIVSEKMRGKPLSESHIQNISKSRTQYFKDNPESISKMSAKMISLHASNPNKFKKALIAMHSPDSRKKAEATRKRGILSGLITPQNNAFRGSYYRKDLNHHFRSRWEANIARFFKFYNIKYEYESKNCRFDLGLLGSIILDFYLPNYSCFLEISGYVRPDKVQKLKSFRKLYSGKKLYILDGEEYPGISKRYCSIIPNWEK